MASGGARGHSGPAAQQNALNRDRKDDREWTILPASGREGPAPEWPLEDISPREAHIWRQEWKRPQAIEWERNGQEWEVALYVRRLNEADRPSAPIQLGTLIKQMQESLGLSAPGLARNRWRIGEVQTSGPRVKGGAAGPSARDRLNVVSDGD